MTITHVALIVLGLLALLYAYFGMSRSRLASRKRAPEGSLDQQSLIEPEPASASEDLGEVHAALARGEMVVAVKAYRDATGAGLLESKQAVGRLVEGGSATGSQT